MRSKPNEGSKFNRIYRSQIDFPDRYGSVGYLLFIAKYEVVQGLDERSPERPPRTPDDIRDTTL